MYPIKIKEKYDPKNLNNLGHRFSVVYLGTYIKDDFIEGNGSHPGVDIIPEIKNQDIFAVLDGTVFKSGEDGAYGKYIFLEHKDVPNPDNFSSQTILYSCYQHLSEIYVNIGDVIKEGDLIGKTGNTGNSFGEHLHFQIDKKEAPFHAYWPFTGTEVREIGVSFTQGVNMGLGLEKAKMYTINPLVYLDKIEEFKINKPKQNKEINKEITTKEESEKIIKKEELIVDNDEKNLLVSLDIKDVLHKHKDESKLKNQKKNFKDIKDTDKYFEYINNLAEKGILSGFKDGTFRPNNTITRSEFLKLLFLVKGISLSDDNTDYFTDVLSNSWQKKYIYTGVNLGLISTENKIFKPNSFVTRVEALKMAIILFIGNIELVYSQKLSDVSGSEWYAKYTEYAVNNNLLSITNNCFFPNKNITRIEVIEILYKLSGN